MKGGGVDQEYGETIAWFKKAVAQGDPRAQFCLGVMYEEGYGVGQDYAEAVACHRKSTDQDYAEAQY